MAENKSSTLPRFDSLQDLVEFFDTHDMGEYWEHMPEAHFAVDIKRRSRLVSIEEELMRKLSAVAKTRHVSVETLINLWLKEKVAEVH